MPVLTPDITEAKPRRGGPAPPPRWPDGFGGGDSGEPEDSGSGFPLSKAQVGMWLVVTVVVMLFAGLSSAYIVLRGLPTWQNIAVPPLVWMNTIVLILSSFTLESARHAVKNDRHKSVTLWIGVTGIFGLLFLAGQIMVWRQLVAAGVYLPSTLHSSFFYVLTGLHGVHIIGGMVGLSIIFFKSTQRGLTSASHEPFDVCALYWHFMDAIWIYLFLLLILA